MPDSAPRLRFRTKLFLVFGLLVATALGAALVVVRIETERRVRDDFDERFARTIAAFRQLQDLRRRTVADEVDVLVRSNPVFRTILSTVSVAEDDLGFGGAPPRDEQLRDANLRLRSLLPSLAVASRHDVFAVASAAGELVYTRVDPERFGASLSEVPPLARAARGEEAIAVWNQMSDLPERLSLAPGTPPDAVYEVVAEPVVFGTELHGLVLVGARIASSVSRSMRVPTSTSPCSSVPNTTGSATTSYTASAGVPGASDSLAGRSDVWLQTAIASSPRAACASGGTCDSESPKRSGSTRV